MCWSFPRIKTSVRLFNFRRSSSDDVKIDLSATLVSYGIDSIAFTQIRGRVVKEFGVDVPMVLLSDAFTLQDVIRHVSERVAELK
jgi:acyl carrier protein